jgi:hypothetical protein
VCTIFKVAASMKKTDRASGLVTASREPSGDSAMSYGRAGNSRVCRGVAVARSIVANVLVAESRMYKRASS